MKTLRTIRTWCGTCWRFHTYQNPKSPAVILQKRIKSCLRFPKLATYSSISGADIESRQPTASAIVNFGAFFFCAGIFTAEFLMAALLCARWEQCVAGAI